MATMIRPSSMRIEVDGRVVGYAYKIEAINQWEFNNYIEDDVSRHNLSRYELMEILSALEKLNKDYV